MQCVLLINIYDKKSGACGGQWPIFTKPKVLEALWRETRILVFFVVGGMQAAHLW